MMAAVGQFLGDLTLYGDKKLDELHLVKASGLKWLQEREPEYLQAFDKIIVAPKDGVFKVPKSTKQKLGGRGGNDENIPPGQHAIAAQTLAAKKAGKEESTPAPPVTRTRQHALRDLPRRQPDQLATPALGAQKTATRLATRNSSRQPAQTTPGVGQTPLRLSPTQAEPESDPATAGENAQSELGGNESVDAPADAEISEARGRVRRSPRGSGGPPQEAEVGAQATGMEEEGTGVEREPSVAGEPSGPALDTGSEEQNVEQDSEGPEKPATRGAPKRKGKKQAKEKEPVAPAAADVSGAEAAVRESLQAGEASKDVSNEMLGQVLDATTETAEKSGGKEPGAGGREPGSAEEGNGEKEATNEAAPGGRVTRRRAKETGAELAALPSGLADGKETKRKGRARNGKKARRIELDGDVIRQETHEEEPEVAQKSPPSSEQAVEANERLKVAESLEEVAKGGGSGQQLVGVETKPSKQMRLCMDGGRGDTPGRTVAGKSNSGSPTGQKGGAVVSETGVDPDNLETDVVPETPEDAPVRKSGRNKRANGEAPPGRTTRGGAAKRRPNADVSSEASGSSEPSSEALLAVPEPEVAGVTCQADVTLKFPAETVPAERTETKGVQEEVQVKPKKAGKAGKGKKAQQKKRPESAETNGSSGAENSLGKELDGQVDLERGLVETDGVSEKPAEETPGPVSSPAASANPAPRSSLETSFPSAGSLGKSPTEPAMEYRQRSFASPVPETPNLRLTRSTAKRSNSHVAELNSSAFGSPLYTAPESARHENRFGKMGSPKSMPRSGAKSPLFPEIVLGVEFQAGDELGEASRAASTPQDELGDSHRAVQEPTPTAPLSLLPSPQPLGRVTRSTSRAPDSDSKRGLVVESRSPLIPAQAPGGTVDRTPLSSANPETPAALPPAQEPVKGGDSPLAADLTPQHQVSPIEARITRSASRDKSSTENPSTPVSGSATPSTALSSLKRSRKEDEVSNQLTPSTDSIGLAETLLEEATPEGIRVLTRSQGKLQKSLAESPLADAAVTRNVSSDVLAGDVRAVSSSAKIVPVRKVEKSVSPITRSANQQSPFASPLLSAALDKLPAPRNSTPETRSQAKKRAHEDSQRESPTGRSASIAVDLSTLEPSPTVDMDVCTTPLTAGPRRVLRPLTGKRSAAGTEKSSPEAEAQERKCSGGANQEGLTSFDGEADVRGPLRRSPRLRGEGSGGGAKPADETPPRDALAAAEEAQGEERERSAKKMRLSGGFALTEFGGELIDLDNEDEDLMEPNFAVDSNGLRRSARKTASGREESLGNDGKARLSFDVDLADDSAPGDVTADDRKRSTGTENGVGAEDGEFRFSAYKSARRSARKGSAGRHSFVSASEEGAGSAGTGEGSPGASDGGASARGKTPAKRSNLMSGFSSFLGFLAKKEPAGPPIPGNNKNNVKGSIKALEAAEAARREEAQKAEERQKRKALQEKRREEKLKELAAGAVQQPKVPTSKPADPLPEKRLTVLGAAAVTATITDQKLRRANEFRSRIEEEKARRLEEEQKKKDEERRKKDADAARKKRQREEDDKREREEKRRRYEDVAKTRKEVYERQRAEQEEKERKRREKELEVERKQAADEEERKRKKEERKEKELEAERRRKDDDEKRAAKLREKEEDRKRQEGLFMRRKEDERNEKMLPRAGLKPSTPIKTFLAENAASVRLSPLKGTDKIMPPPRTTPSRHAPVDNQNQYAAPSLSKTPASRLLNPAYASSSLAAKPSGLQYPKPVANPPSNLRLTGWEDRAAKAKSGQAAAGTLAKSGAFSLQGGGKALADRARTPPPPEDVESYEISPFKESTSSDDDEDDEESESEKEKRYPAWTRQENLAPALRRQIGVDPDDVFVNLSVKTCSLGQVFGTTKNRKKKDFGRRSSSGNWLEDRLTWKEELQYKKGMGYL